MNKILSSALICLCINMAYSNNITVSNVTLTGQNLVDEYTYIQFDLSWENSWRIDYGPANWDAAWVFAKVRLENGDWQHVNLAYVDGTAANDGHIEPVGCTISTYDNGLGDGTGAMIYRSANGTGTVNFISIQLKWYYVDNGINPNDVVDVQVFAIEMVYVPQGSYYLGGIGTEVAQFYAGAKSENTIYEVASEAAITISNTVNNLYYEVGLNGGDQTGALSANYPKGYQAFYCMKYEASQGQWVAFFNTLTNTQKSNLDITDANHKNSDGVVNRNSISWGGGAGSASTTTEDRPVNFVGADFINAYLDWSGLRPMTELEYEKASRGIKYPVANELACGTGSYNGSTNYIISNDGATNEMVSNPQIGTGNVLCAFNNGGYSGPFRVGIFAASAINKTREETGGSYYGIMELSGNLNEVCVTVGNSTGRSFTGGHGDGILAANGQSNVALWPSNADGTGYGLRGGSWSNADLVLIEVSRRIHAATSPGDGSNRTGFRGVRTAQ